MEEKKVIYLSDNPNIEKDSFEVHSQIAETFFEIISRHDVSKNSFTIGLFGEWGSGKSFIINKLQNKIINSVSEKLTYLYIDVWKYSGFPLLRGILFDLNKQFKKNYKDNNNKYDFFKNGYVDNKGKSLKDILNYDETFESHSKLTSKDFKEKLKKIWEIYKVPYIILTSSIILFFVFQFFPTVWLSNRIIKSIYEILKSIAPISSFISISGLLLFLFKKPLKDIVELIFFRNTVKNYTEKANFSPEQFEGIFKNMLTQIKEEKYVIVFDNLDRCEPKIAYETLSTIKTYMDIKNCFYIIPADDEAIKNYLSNFSNEKEKYNNSFQRKFAEEFIDKIFQTYIRIPILKEVERDNYIKEQLKRIDFEEELIDEEIETITQILYFAYKGESPRNIIRFINDYSTYFQLALKSLPKLLDNITLFTIMIAIKQKWYECEKILIENPTFFAEYPDNKDIINNIDKEIKKDFLVFLENISVFFIPQIKNESIDSYIHFKESEKSYEISEFLKTNQPDNIQLNDENIKILIKEFRKNIKKEGVFSVNSFLTFASIIKNNLGKKIPVKLIKEFWAGFIKISPEQIKSILRELLDNDIIINIINTLKNIYLEFHKSDIEQKFITYLNEPIGQDSGFEEYQKIFEAILKSKYRFTPNRVKGLFENWKKENIYLSSLLSIISENETTEYLPENVLDQLINSDIDAVSIELLKNWDCNSIPKSSGIKLLNVTSQRLNSRNFNDTPLLVQQKSSIEEDYQLILLLDSSFVNQDNKEEFFNNFINLITRVFQFANNQQSIIELGINLWIELAYFESIDNELIDTKMFDIFNSYIKPNETTISFLKENISYPKKLLSLKSTKHAIFDISQELQTCIYEGLEKKYLSNFKLVLSYPLEIKHIKSFTNFTNEKKIHLEKNKLSKFLLQQIIKELIEENQDISGKLEYIRTNFDLKPHKKIIIDNKNGIIDFYKKGPSIVNNILKEIKFILSYSEFFNSILKPILNFIKSELEKSETITDYTNLYELVEISNNQDNNSLLYLITKQCLEKNQELNENYFGIRILEKIYNNISQIDKIEISELININDNKNQWEEEFIEILDTLSIDLGGNNEDQELQNT